MNKYTSFITILFLLVIPLFGQAEFFVDMTNPEDLENPDDNLEYLIIPGDCLWNLADKFYDDPWKWPEIFNANSYVKNPHWIFYDNWLVIPGILMEKSMAAAAEDDDAKVSKCDTLDKEPVSEMVDKTSDVSETEAGAEVEPEPQIDEETVAVPAETAEVVTIDVETDETSAWQKEYSRCGRTGFNFGIQVGYPLIELPNEEEGSNYGLFIGTPIGVAFGPLDVGIGAAILTYDFKDIYPGVGLLGNLCLNDLLQLDTPLKFQLGGGLFYVVGGGLGTGGGISVGIPLGESPFSLRFYAAAGTYQDDSDETNSWGNTGALLMYSF
jgi:hypothetical protein